MRMQYKKVGDTFTYPEYNAMCYLLTHGTWTESFDLKLNETTSSQYADYILDDRNELLSETRDGYAIVKNIDTMNVDDRLIYLTINHENLHSHIEVLFHAVHVTHISQQISDSEYMGTDMNISIQEEDFLDEIGVAEEEVTIYHSSELTPIQSDVLISIAHDVGDDDSVVLSFDPVAYGLSKGDWISNVADLTLTYIEPEINYTDGELGEDDEIICQNFDELQTVVNTAPEGVVTKIRLLGTTYTFTDQLRITDKSIHIHGGNLDTPNDEPFTVLDAQEIGRHFIVDPDASLTINNCKLVNGNVYGEKGRYVLHNRGGSIYCHGKYVLDFDHYVVHGGFVNCNNCWFINNTAMLGGAIYNTMGKCELHNCLFDGNKAIEEDRSEAENTYYYNINNWGGAIFTETSLGLYYNDSTDRLHIATSPYSYSNNKTTIQLNFYKQQNTLLLEKEEITKNNLKLFDYSNKSWLTVTKVTKVESNDPLMNTYNVVVSEELTTNHKYYFKFTGSETQPSIISYTLKAVGGNLQ